VHHAVAAADAPSTGLELRAAAARDLVVPERLRAPEVRYRDGLAPVPRIPLGNSADSPSRRSNQKELQE
jgi:hypothetical protein